MLIELSIPSCFGKGKNILGLMKNKTAIYRRIRSIGKKKETLRKKITSGNLERSDLQELMNLDKEILTLMWVLK